MFINTRNDKEIYGDEKNFDSSKRNIKMHISTTVLTSYKDEMNKTKTRNILKFIKNNDTEKIVVIILVKLRVIAEIR